MAKQSCTYISSFILFIFAFISLVFAALVTFDVVGEGDFTKKDNDEPSSEGIKSRNQESTGEDTQSSNSQNKNVFEKILTIPNEKSFSACCIYLISSLLLLAIGFVFR